MSKEKLLETLGQVKEEFIEEAAPKGVLDSKDTSEEPVKKSGRITKLYPYIKWGALAACLCIIVGLSVKVMPFSAAKNDAAYESADQMKPVTESETFNTKADAYFPTQDMDSATGTGDLNYSINSDDTAMKEEGMKVTEKPKSAAEPEDKGFPDWGLSFEVKNVSATGLTLVVTQSGGNPSGELMTGEPYRLITLVDETWKTVEELPLPEGVDGRAWNSIGYPIAKGETREFDINWEWIFGELPSGTYRIIKEFMDFRKTADYDTADFWIEFEIK